MAILSFSLAAFQLHRIGPPPTIRVDALWVREHQQHVQFLTAELAVAFCGWIIAFFFSRRKRWIAACGLVALIALAIVFSDRVLIIAEVMWKHGR